VGRGCPCGCGDDPSGDVPVGFLCWERKDGEGDEGGVMFGEEEGGGRIGTAKDAEGGRNGGEGDVGGGTLAK